MDEDAEGFLYPELNYTKCIDCNLCMKVCPILQSSLSISDQQVFALKNKDINIRMTSTSGGVFLSLAEYVINQGGIVFGVKYDSTYKVIHSEAQTIEECLSFQIAKYVQSNLSDDKIFIKVRKYLHDNRLVLFSGTPCQISALKLFLGKQFDNLILCDLICNSVPSPRIFSDYIEFIQKRKTLKSINMRYKQKSWDNSQVKLVYSDGKCDVGGRRARLWLDMAFSRFISRPSCYSCRFTSFEREGDITIGDYWGVKKFYPDFYDKQGVSLVFVNTVKGQKILTELRDKFFIKELDRQKCSQPRLCSPISRHARRDEFWLDYHKNGFEYIIKKYFHFGILNTLVYNSKIVCSKIFHLIIK